MGGPRPIAPPRADSPRARPLYELTPPKSEGPTLPEMDPHLRNTPMTRINMMFATCLVDGLCSKDASWVNHPDFLTVCEYAGLQGDTPELIRRMFNDGTLNLGRLAWWNNGYLKQEQE